jgi:hypothetical protein
VDSGCNETITPDKSESVFLVTDPTFAPVFAMDGLQTPLAFKADPTSVKSRTGYIIKLGGCPLIWKSMLQTEI